MPRKIKPFPAILFTQSLSTGRLIKDKFVQSDIPNDDGIYPMISVPQDERPVRKMLSGDEMIAKQKNKEIAAQKQLLARVGLGDLVGIAKPEPKSTPPALPYEPGKIAIKLGERLVMQVPTIRRW